MDHGVVIATDHHRASHSPTILLCRYRFPVRVATTLPGWRPSMSTTAEGCGTADLMDYAAVLVEVEERVWFAMASTMSSARVGGA